MEKKNIIFDFSIDRGGTFTDVYCEIRDKKTDKLLQTKIYKLLSENPEKYKDAPREGIRTILSEYLKIEISQEEKISSKNIRSIKMGTTVGTNALLEKKGEKVGLVITKGFRDLLEIGNQTRPDIFDLEIKKEKNLYEEVIEIEERVRVLKKNEMIGDIEAVKIVRIKDNNEFIAVEKEINKKNVYEKLMNLKKKGINSLAIVFLHSYIYPDNELEVKKIAEEIGFDNISLSNEISKTIKVVNRGQTTLLAAYLNPIIKNYIKNFLEGFDDSIKNVDLYFMQSDGGLCDYKNFCGSKSILSGPAGGVIAYSLSTEKIYEVKTQNINKETNNYQKKKEKLFNKVIGFDMGGTSTDVSKYTIGSYQHVYDKKIGGVVVQTPHLDIHTVAAGGGSKCIYRDGLFIVGPESVGANPGPICYGRENGELAITDVNLALGRLRPEFFNRFTLQKEKVFEELRRIRGIIQGENDCNSFSVENVAHGFIKIANEKMTNAIRKITEAKGDDPKEFVLNVFGGAGGQHACSIADKLLIKNIEIHKYAGILSAFGLSMAKVVEENSEPLNLILNKKNVLMIDELFFQKIKENKKLLCKKGFNESEINDICSISIHYNGSDTSFSIKRPDDLNFLREFKFTFKKEFGFDMPDRNLIIDYIRVRSEACFKKKEEEIIKEDDIKNLKPESYEKVYFEKDYQLIEVETPIYLYNKIPKEKKILGPALIISEVHTIVVEYDWSVKKSIKGNIIMSKLDKQNIKKLKTNKIICDPIELSLFANRFMSIAENMGIILERTSVSTNIKERLDFSCAIFSPKGDLIANAPHLPVHLGSMQEAVKYQINFLKNNWKEGEVILSNHPSAGGSHLPDITVITPCYMNNKIAFFVASRGHHADVGGITPGSFPPFSKSLNEEGINIKSLKIVREGIFLEKELVEILTNPPDGIHPTRCLSDNIADIKAQIAANERGITFLKELIIKFGIEYVHKYMNFIQLNGEQCVRSMLKTISKQNGMKEVDFVEEEEFMDNGSKIKLKLTIDQKTGSAIFDFTGTGLQVMSNINCPKAVTKSAIIYSLRCLVKKEIPLNQGCLNPVKIIIPKNSILNPFENSPIVGGNVLTSQRVTDLIFKAFKSCAASQGCMNNFLFGNKNFAYYETICGGSGAGPYWNGKSGVHTHMTNTRITDLEILENRYPVVLRKFFLRNGSGGKGRFFGGEGVVREFEFLESMTIVILSERRVFEPFGIMGGFNGKRGENVFVSKKNGIRLNVGGKNEIKVERGDLFIILTPGGGGFGKPV